MTDATKRLLIEIGVALLLIAGAYYLGHRGSAAAFDAEREQRMQQVQQLQTDSAQLRGQNDELRKQRDDNIAHGQALELERDGLRAELEKYGAAAQAAVQKQQEAADNYEKDKAHINLDAPAMQRCHDLCAERAEVGYPCRPSPDAYCDKRYGPGAAGH